MRSIAQHEVFETEKCDLKSKVNSRLLCFVK